MLHQNLNLADAHAICSLILVTKWRVYLPFPIWHAFCHVEVLGHMQLKSIGCQSTCTILGSTCAQSHSFGIRKGILHTWLRSHLTGLRAWVVIDTASRPIVARSWILDGSLLYVYIVGRGPCDTACALARLIPWCKRMKIAWACYNLSMGSLEASCLKKCVKWFRWASGQNKEERKTNVT